MKKLKLSQGKYALVDNADFEYLNQWKWHAWQSQPTQSYYAVRNVKKQGTNKKTVLYLHRALLMPPRDKQIDHINGNGLDNRRRNLRMCSHILNQRNRTRISIRNTSGVTNVYWSSLFKKWHAQVRRNRKNISLGYFKKKKDAKKKVDAFRAKEKRYYAKVYKFRLYR